MEKSNEISIAIQKANAELNHKRKSLIKRVGEQLDEIEEYRTNGGTIRLLSKQLGVDEKVLASAINYAKKQRAKKIERGELKNSNQNLSIKKEKTAGLKNKVENENDTDVDFQLLIRSKTASAFGNTDLPFLNK